MPAFNNKELKCSIAANAANICLLFVGGVEGVGGGGGGGRRYNIIDPFSCVVVGKSK